MGASSAPTPRATGQGMRLSNARTPMKKAATRARFVSPAESGTQLASTVELPKQITMRTTKTAIGKVPVGGRHAMGSDLARLDQADSISCPQEPSEVISLSDHVEVDIRAEVEAQVRLGCTEAGGIDVDGQQRRATPANGLHCPHPRSVRARRDDRDGAPGQAANPVPGHRSGQALWAIGPGHRQVVEDQPVLTHSPVRLEQR